MTRGPKRASAPLSEVAAASGVPIGRVYELFRRPGAPPPVDYVATVPVYGLESAVAYVTGALEPPVAPYNASSEAREGVE